MHSVDDFKKSSRDSGLVLAVRKEYAGVTVLRGSLHPDTPEGFECPLDFVLSTANVDRSKDTIDQSGWQLDCFRKNPVVLWAHDSSAPPVARAPSVLVDSSTGPERLVARGVEFVPREILEMGWAVGQMYRKGFLNAVSVGFLPSEFKFNEERGDWAMDFLKQELLEFSAVPIPANPEALIGAKAAGIPIEWVRGWAEKILDTATEGDGFKPAQLVLVEEMRALVSPKTFQVPHGKDVLSDADTAADLALLEQMGSLEAALIANTAALQANTAAHVAAPGPAAGPDNSGAAPTPPAAYEPPPQPKAHEVTGDSIAAELTRQLSTLTGRT